MFDWLPTDGMAILGYITAGLCVITAILIDWAIRHSKHEIGERDTIEPLSDNEPYKPLHVEV